MRPVFALVLSGLAMLTSSTQAAEPVRLHAAGSLRGALMEVATAFQKANGVEVRSHFGASGLLRDAIAGGEKAEVFASANMEHPLSLVKAGKAGPVALFARNELCAFARPGLVVKSATLLDMMLDPSIRLGISTPKADPSGDYAFAVFTLAEKLKTGAKASLESKALQLTGGPASRQPKPDRNLYGELLGEGAADIFLAYCTNGAAIAEEQPGATLTRLPEALAVGADYGLTVMNTAPPEAYRFAMFILSGEGQRILQNHGFAVPALPRE